MTLKPHMPSRRRFLEHSVLGFGSLVFSSSLLQSCTDHNIPDPNGPDTNPPLALEVDWNEAGKETLKLALEHVPVAGEFLGILADMLWPKSKEDRWAEIKEKVEALVDQKIADHIYQQVSEDLEGLNNAITLYVHELASNSTNGVLMQWTSTRTEFVQRLPHFQSAGYEVMLLPFYTQFTNMYLSLLRDVVKFGRSWGRNDSEQLQDILDLQTAITKHYDYAVKTYFSGRDQLQATTKADNQRCEPFRTLNQYDRQMTLSVLDYSDMWWAYDSSHYPKDGEALSFYNREIYSDPYGICVSNGNIVLPTPIAKQFPTNLTVWAYDRIDAVQLTYPAGSGPGNNVTTTPRMGDASGGSNQSPHGGSFNISPNNPITQARVIYSTYQFWTNEIYGPFPARLQFGFSDGTSTGLMGGTNGAIRQNDSGWIAYGNRALSSVYINGVNSRIESAEAVVFGFQPWSSPTAKLDAVKAIYVKSPKERIEADLANDFSKHNVPSNLITEELKAERRAYWEHIAARVKEING